MFSAYVLVLFFVIYFPELSKALLWLQKLFRLQFCLLHRSYLCAKKAVRAYRILFEISGDIPNQKTRQAMAEVDEMIKNGTGKKVDSAELLFE